MARIMYLDAGHAENLAFSYSPLHEAVRSLHVLTRSKSHPLHLPWVLRTRRLMSPALKAEVVAFSFLFGSRIPDIFENGAPSMQDFPAFEEQFRVMQALPTTNYVEQVVNNILLNDEHYSCTHILESLPLQQQIVQQTAEQFPAALPVMKEMLADPEKGHARFLNFFADYWTTCIEPEWPQLEELLLQDIQQRGQMLFEQGPLKVLGSLAPQLSAYQHGGQITLQYPAPHEIEMQASEQLVLVPSAFVWPRLSFMYAKANVLHALVYSIRRFQEEGSIPVPPERLLTLLRAVGDMTRLQILRLLSQRPRSTRELAGLLNLSEAGISKQVKLLQSAGLVTAERASYYVLYRSVRSPLTEIARGLEGIFLPE
ncbi:DNA-binding transcriptional ArsR family regulator [Thermosporothrix hazakensis]|uniref:DNA-binding transcriptional ArsR family regulator n=2 Tax=Thermosporothrix TaxID=768650 RepID=A0A326UIF9_THEHA|nr:DUF5937 family protein [Thermosporothrix hazakensis]PZW28039.1 DNA-binding transcriptional ArsR family regulator [Thermosporothrix hazakensis]BBH86970.1 ArsR family transcriptional regulator [Thermosporothrix sp. COM3]GCE51261.1 ArsR family transcriptional regulator [Thermosporothrix hazakensis]